MRLRTLIVTSSVFKTIGCIVLGDARLDPHLMCTAPTPSFSVVQKFAKVHRQCLCLYSLIFDRFNIRNCNERVNDDERIYLNKGGPVGIVRVINQVK